MPLFLGRQVMASSISVQWPSVLIFGVLRSGANRSFTVWVSSLWVRGSGTRSVEVLRGKLFPGLSRGNTLRQNAECRWVR